MAKIVRNDHVLFAFGPICIDNIFNENTDTFSEVRDKQHCNFYFSKATWHLNVEMVQMTVMTFLVLSNKRYPVK